jgi:hypothetical protein
MVIIMFIKIPHYKLALVVCKFTIIKWKFNYRNHEPTMLF